ncbi:hypothetical protein TcCL_Unassigned04374 [Trypanosoma cruzi]|nr:hypothetical protein TcCL_Unassigned04374 [Trypanosoma cruzi]
MPQCLLLPSGAVDDVFTGTDTHRCLQARLHTRDASCALRRTTLTTTELPRVVGRHHIDKKTGIRQDDNAATAGKSHRRQHQQQHQKRCRPRSDVDPLTQGVCGREQLVACQSHKGLTH